MARLTRATAASSRKSPASTNSQIKSLPKKRTGTKIVGNSSDNSSDEPVLLAGSEISVESSNQWPKVIIPLYASGEHESAAASVASAEISVSNDSSIEDADTPLTSAAATPFEKRGTRSTSRRSTAFKMTNVSDRLSSLSGLSSKRVTGLSRVNQIDADEQLAQNLQEEEYNGDETLQNNTRTVERRRVVDSEDDESEDEFAASLIPTVRKRKQVAHVSQTHKRQKVEPAPSASRSHLPARNARFKARTSLGATIVNEDVDDDEEPILDDDNDDASFSSASELTELSDASDTSDLPLVEVSKSSDTEKSHKKKPSAKPSKGKRSAHRALYKKYGESRSSYERRRLEYAHPQLKTLWDDLATIPVIKAQKASQPEGINRTLKSFQLEGVDWMRRMETEGQWKGGLLGDEMGMGKTIQAVSLIMSDYPAGRPTLVVVPPVALMQWSSEIKAYTDGKLKVLVHHNTDPKVKKLKVADLMKYDVIMISYAGLESMHRKEVKGWKRDDALVKENSRIHAIEYHRLILDEAHSIKTRTTQVAKACFALKSNRKWCLSGTPVQNRIGEFFSLLRFLEVEPFASYFCKDCDCESLHWSTDESGKCASCNHTGFNHVSLFNQELLNPITSGDLNDRAKAMRKLRLLTDRIMLRRMKRDHTSSMELPPKQVDIHNEFFGPEERDFSASIMTNTTRTFDTYVARGVELNNYANIFGLIMQMRQVANHPDLILKKKNNGGQNILVCCICDEPAEEPIRSQCHHEFCRKCAKDYVRSFASHGNDPDCPSCHIMLRIDFDQPDIEQDEDVVKKSSIINRIKMDDWHSSTKIEMLIYELFQLRSQKRTAKSIVFSQFTSMLQLVEWRLRRAGFSTVMLDGSMSPGQRQKSIEHFMKNVNVEIFLVSLKAGGVALNLTEASRVFIVDPWWNPAAEWQSADRCHRIGQKRACKITRLCIEDSVESRMVLLQEKKANLINGTVNGDDVALGKLTPEDLQFLFRGT